MAGVFSKIVREVLATTCLICVCIFMTFDDLVFRTMKLGSEGVYLHEKCRTNPSRYLPGPKTPVKN